MTTPAPAPGAPGEVTGLTSALAYAGEMTRAYASAASDAESFAAGLGGHGVDGTAVTAVGRAKELTAQAGAAWAEAGEALDRQGVVRDAYATAPDAGDKDFITDNATGVATATTAASSAGDSPAVGAERSERDQLARGLHIGDWPPPWDRDRARNWDADQIDPQERADAYAQADKILAERAAIAAGPGGDRLGVMHYNGVTRCPSWCPQPDDEEQYEEHIGPARTITTDDGGEVSVRPRVSWWSDTEPSVEVTVAPGEDGTSRLILTSDELIALQRLTDEVMDEAEREHRDAPAETGKPAYPGARYDEVDDIHTVLDPRVAAAALDAKSRTGYLQLGEDDESSPHLDWTTVDADQVHQLDAYDGDWSVSIPLDPHAMRQLRDGIGRLIGEIDDGQDDPGQILPVDEDDDFNIDWSSVHSDVRSVEFADGNGSVALEMTEPELRDWYQQLDLQIHLDENDGLDLRGQTAGS